MTSTSRIASCVLLWILTERSREKQPQSGKTWLFATWSTSFSTVKLGMMQSLKFLIAFRRGSYIDIDLNANHLKYILERRVMRLPPWRDPNFPL